MRFGRAFRVGLAAVVICSGLGSARSAIRIKSERFDRDPGWKGVRNHIRPHGCERVAQDFGFSAERQAVGGQVWRSTTPAYYAERIAPRTLDDGLHASGWFTLVESAGASGVFFGWFNSARQGFRPVNFLGLRLDGEADGATLHVDYTTGTWKAAGLNTGLHVAPDGAKHHWELCYDPSGNDGGGRITFALDGGAPQRLDLLPGHRGEGATFDRFGIFNLQIPGGPMTAYFDDVQRNGKVEGFAADPGWEGAGNRASFADCEREDSQDFGFRETHFAGGAPGEMGGTFWRTEPEVPHDAYYADRVGVLTLQDTLYASGKVAFTRAAVDSGIYLGWFKAGTREAPLRNFVGVVVEGPSRIGHYFRVAYATAQGESGDSGKGPVIRPDGAAHTWTLFYDPEAKGGAGAVRATLDGAPVTLDLAPGRKEQGARFDHFGVFTMGRGGHYMTIYFDDLRYTSAAPRRQGASRSVAKL